MRSKRPNPARVKESARARFTEEQFVSALMSVPEFRESLSPSDAILDAEDVGWIGSRTGWDELDRSPLHREKMVRNCRALWHGDPLAKQAVRLWTDYAVGTGITYKATAGKTTDAGTQKELDKFWKHRKNKQKFTSSRGQQRLSKKLLVDGELFFAIFSGGKVPIIRTIDCLQIKDIISDPDDDDEILCYKRVDKSSPPKTTYYKDWAADEDKLNSLRDPDDKRKKITLEEDVVIYHLPYDDLGKRGNSLLSSVIGWTEAHRRFMEKRVSITAALARFAWNASVKGGQAAIDSFKKDLNSSLSGSSRSRERNPVNASGGTFAHNQGVDMVPVPRTTGAGDAKSDGDQLKLMFCAGTNFPQHYFGDASNANLATATAMELPVLKVLTSYQQFWKDFWRDLFAIVLGEDIDAEPAPIQIALPPLLQDDLKELGTFLKGLHDIFPEISVPEVLRLCLIAMGANDVDQIMESVEVKQTELAAAAEKVTQTQPPAITPPTPQDVKVTEAKVKSLVQALNRHTKVLQEVFAA